MSSVFRFNSHEESTILPQDIQLDILYEDDAIIALNKPPDMGSIPAPAIPMARWETH